MSALVDVEPPMDGAVVDEGRSIAREVQIGKTAFMGGISNQKFYSTRGGWSNEEGKKVLTIPIGGS